MLAKMSLTLALISFGWLSLTQAASAAPDNQNHQNFSVALLLFDDVQIIDFSAPYEVFGQAGFDVFTVSANGNTVTTAMGLSVNPAHSFDTMPTADAILVPGGDVHAAMHDKQTLSWLRQQQTDVAHILSVCTGSHIVAESGLLDGLSATTFHNALNSFAKQYPKIAVEPDKRFVDNGQIITSAGLSSGIDASLYLVSKVRGIEKAKSVALHIEYDWDPEGDFVRAVMADRHFPENNYDWPEGILFDELSSVGDTTTWQKVYTARTSAPRERLIEAYQTAMSHHDNWRPVENQSKGQFSWQRTGEHKQWLHHFSVEATSDEDMYYLTISIEQAQATHGT